MIQLSRTQDEEVGDGTTSVIILAGELLQAAEPLLERHLHPTVLVRGYTRALEDAIKVCGVEKAVSFGTMKGFHVLVSSEALQALFSALPCWLSCSVSTFVNSKCHVCSVQPRQAQNWKLYSKNTETAVLLLLFVHLFIHAMLSCLCLLIQVAESMTFDINTDDRSQMLQVVQSCIGTKYTSRFGTLMAVSDPI